MSLDDFFRVNEVEERLRQEAEEEARRKAEEERRAKAEEIRKRRAARSGAAAAPVPPAPLSPAPTPLVPPVAAAGTVIEELPDRYRLHNLQYRNGLYTVDWGKELLENGANKTQDKWIAATQAGDWKLADQPLYFASLRHLYQNQNHAEQRQKQLVEQVRAVFKADFDPQKPYMMTSSKIKYTARGDDLVTHRFGYPDQQKIQAAMVGSDGHITARSGMSTALEALLGTGDGAEVETVGEWVTGMKAYLWRFNQKPKQDEERAVVLGCIVSRFDIVASDVLVNLRPARGVVVYSAPAGT